MGLKIKKWLTNSQFELWEARAPRQTPSRRLQALVGEHAQRQTQLTPESYHRTYYASIDKMLSELELRFRGNDQEIICALGNICNSETPDKESFSRIAKFYNIDGEILEAEQKMYASFRRVRGLGYMTVSEILETMHENDLFNIFPEFQRWCISLQWYLLHRVQQSADHSVRCADLKLTSAAPWGNNVSATLKGHMPTLLSAMTWTASLISSAVEMEETAISFKF